MLRAAARPIASPRRANIAFRDLVGHRAVPPDAERPRNRRYQCCCVSPGPCRATPREHETALVSRILAASYGPPGRRYQCCFGCPVCTARIVNSTGICDTAGSTEPRGRPPRRSYQCCFVFTVLCRTATRKPETELVSAMWASLRAVPVARLPGLFQAFGTAPHHVPKTPSSPGVCRAQGPNGNGSDTSRSTTRP